VVLAAALELIAAADGQVANGGGDQHLTRRRGVLNASSEVHGQPDDILVRHLALAGVQPGADLNAESSERTTEPRRAIDRASQR
jgi:hypothetical protein